jgi:hypothetical protein
LVSLVAEGDGAARRLTAVREGAADNLIARKAGLDEDIDGPDGAAGAALGSSEIGRTEDRRDDRRSRLHVVVDLVGISGQ